MSNQPISSMQAASDTTDLNAIRRAARENSPDALKAAARQFEALFMNMMLKSMRSTTTQNTMFDSNQTKLYTSMLDQELSQKFAKRGIGLADAMLRQMSNHGRAGTSITSATNTTSTAAETPVKSTPAAQAMTQAALENGQKALIDSLLSSQTGGNSASKAISGVLDRSLSEQMLATDSMRDVLTDAIRQQQNLMAVRQQQLQAAYSAVSSSSKPAHVRAFQEKLGAHAEEASRVTGIPAKFMLGQAALESGWGKRVIKASDGTPSNNLFGIKAGKGWKGKVVETTTTEYVNGVAYRKKEKFRAYDSYADSFKDYARLLKSNPRYQNVIANSQDAVGFARGLQRAGYATDPQYAVKLTRIIQNSLSA
ncbi:MAG: flgJ [Burkholderiaceae bacterium]|nr:flgJ [Burkholderiaceae bacterium]